MKSFLNWEKVAVFKLCLLLVWLKQAASGKEVAHKGYISIDCGATSDYVDETTGIWYQTDDKFVENGINYELSPDSNSNIPYVEQQLNRLRSFPKGNRNCYTLKPDQEIVKNKREYNYLIRALFKYGNYDGKNEIPFFDVYLGINYWETIEFPNVSFNKYHEVIQEASEVVQVCLVNTGRGVPFINALELRPLNKSLYSSPLPLSLRLRIDVGSGPVNELIRYKDDVYDRLWVTGDHYDITYWSPFETSGKINPKDSSYMLPSEVLSTASLPSNNSNNMLHVNWSYGISYQYYTFLHFAEIQKLPPGHKRIINVTFGGDNLYVSQPLEYLKPVTLASKNATKGYAAFTIMASAQSEAPPILNALEIYIFVPQTNLPTHAEDVKAIMEIKNTYGISIISWQSDPCVPLILVWEGLNCSSDKNPRIISLNLNSRKLTGEIAASFANLKKLEFLDLSNNELTGHIPEFLADIPNLKFLNLTGNKLVGSIPKALREKANLDLSVANNPGLCQTESCKSHKFIIPLVSAVLVLVMLVIVSLMIWILRKKRLALSTESQKTGVLRQMSQAFSYSQVVRITNNFATVIGEGGFGKVYRGTLDDGTQVAVKLLSRSSQQGYKEFQSEAQLLAIAHHRNLVSLVGYCHEDDIKILIYEYMDNGDLSRLLSDKNSVSLKWNERLQVAIDAARGLDYLHNGCKTPIIHRDLKPSNILLNKSMVAKIADFGLSRAFTNEIDTHLSTQPAGTPGYIDPEFQRSGNLNKKSDIYSFGMILLQLITGHPPIRRESEKVSFILDWVRPEIERGNIQDIVDPKLAGEFDDISIQKAVEIAMSCVSPEPSQRPEISDILHELKNCLALEMDRVKAESTDTQGSSVNYSGQSDPITTISAR